jgi:nicotinamidase-related amidase
VLLRQLGISTVILTGTAGDSCVLASAFDARMRDFDVVVPQDCVASITAQRNRSALAVMKAMELSVTTSAKVRA